MSWETIFLAKRRKEWASKIVKAQYYVNGKWHDGQITMKEIDGINLVIRFSATEDEGTKITQVRLLDTSGDVAYTNSLTLEMSSGRGGLIQITAPIDCG